MKKVIILAIAIFSLSVSAQEINWLTFEEALEAQKTNPKKIFIDAYTVWCGPCKMLDKNTFGNKDVANYMNENYYAVKFNAEGNETINFNGTTYTNPNFNADSKGRNSSHQLSEYFRISAYPTVIFLDEETNLITPLPGYRSPQQIEIFLKLFASNEYKNIQTKEDWEKYNSNFTPEFKE